MILPYAPFDLLTFAFWGFLITLLVVAVLFAALASLRKLPYAVWVSGGTLILAMLLLLGVSTSTLTFGHGMHWVPAGGAAGAMITLLALSLAAFGGGPVAQLALALATRGSVAAGAHGGILVTDAAGAAPASAAPAALAPDAQTPGAPASAAEQTTATPHTREVLRGGAAIGVLERICVALGIVAGFPEALAIIVAVKGLGRFTELATAEARERFIIGTLASLLWASACAVLVRLAIG